MVAIMCEYDVSSAGQGLYRLECTPVDEVLAGRVSFGFLALRKTQRRAPVRRSQGSSGPAQPGYKTA
jgi:hypothetical protein